MSSVLVVQGETGSLRRQGTSGLFLQVAALGCFLQRWVSAWRLHVLSASFVWSNLKPVSFRLVKPTGAPRSASPHPSHGVTGSSELPAHHPSGPESGLCLSLTACTSELRHCLGISERPTAGWLSLSPSPGGAWVPLQIRSIPGVWEGREGKGTAPSFCLTLLPPSSLPQASPEMLCVKALNNPYQVQTLSWEKDLHLWYSSQFII